MNAVAEGELRKPRAFRNLTGELRRETQRGDVKTLLRREKGPVIRPARKSQPEVHRDFRTENIGVAEGGADTGAQRLRGPIGDSVERVRVADHGVGHPVEAEKCLLLEADALVELHREHVVLALERSGLDEVAGQGIGGTGNVGQRPVLQQVFPHRIHERSGDYVAGQRDACRYAVHGGERVRVVELLRAL